MEESRALEIAFPVASHHRAALAWLSRFSDQPITYTDAVSFAVMRARDCQYAISFDHDFAVAGFTPWRALG
jgi:predicted nucleic acid-binding protein